MIEKPDEYFMNRVKNGDLTAMAELFETSADIELQTVTGTMYSDFDF